VINLDPVAFELANLRKQIQLMKAELIKYKEGGVIIVEELQNGTKRVDSPKIPRNEQQISLEEQIKKLKEENSQLRKENTRVESRATELREKCIQLEKQKEIDQLKSFSANGQIDVKFEEIIGKHLEEIEDLKDKLSKTEAELHSFKTFDPDQFQIPIEVESALTYELDEDFNLQISASTQKLLEELQKSDLFDFDTSTDYVPSGFVFENGELEFGISDSTSKLLAELELNQFGVQ